MTVVLGPNFVTEIKAAGLSGLPFSWSGDGVFYDEEALTPQQKADLQAVIDGHNPNTSTADDIRLEAERRIEAGITVDGKAFRADDQSTARIKQIIDGFAAGLAPAAGVVFRTAAGDAFTLASSAEAEAIYAGQLQWRAAVLAASAALQDSLPVDYAADSHWPSAVAVAVSLSSA
jgi:hypothetical protein